MVILLLSGCGTPFPASPSAPATSAAGSEQAVSRISPADSAEANLTRPATVTGYLVGPKPADMPAVMDAVNKKLRTDLNTTLEVNFINWGDIATRYPLILSAGEGVDWIYTANWCQYFTEAPKGAFLELDLDTLSRWMPMHMAATPAKGWEDARISGGIFMIPTATPDIKHPVMLIREDLRRKYDIPEITRFTDLEPYLAALKEHEPGMIPLNLDNGYDVSCCRQTIMGEDGFMPGVLCDGVTFNVEDPEYKVVAYTDEPVLSSYRKASRLMKSWYDKQYTNPNPFSNNIRSKESFQAGKSGVGLGNLYDVDANIQIAAALGFEVKVIPLLSKTGRYVRDPYINNGVAIAASSRQPERTMMVLDLLMENPEYNDLVTFGIEGRNYRLTDDGKIRLIPPAPGESPIYTHTGFWFTNKNQWRPLADWPEQYAEMRTHAGDKLFDMPLSAFAFTNANVRTELTRVGAAFKRYGDPLAVGAVDDVDETLRVLATLMKGAGVDVLKQEARLQIKEYLAARSK